MVWALLPAETNAKRLLLPPELFVYRSALLEIGIAETMMRKDIYDTAMVGSPAATNRRDKWTTGESTINKGWRESAKLKST